MIKIISNRVGSIMKEREKLEELLKVKLSNRGKEIYIEGPSLEEYEAEKVIDAMSFGFKQETALMIKENELSLEILNIKDHTTRKDLKSVRARIIGTERKTLKTLTQLTDCFFEVRNNEVGIIGSAENMKKAQDAVISLIKGSKQANVYSFLEKHQPKPILDLGLKDPEKDIDL